MLHGVRRVLPGNIVAVRLRHHTGVVALATIGNQCLIDLIHLVVVLRRRQFVGHLLEDCITLGVHSKGVVVDGLRIEQVILDILIVGLISQCSQDIQLILGTFRLPQFDIHLHTFLSDQIVRCGLLSSRLFSCVDGFISTTQQVEGFLPEILLIIETRCLDGTLHTLMDLAFVVIVVESMDIQGTGRGDILTRVYGFRTFLQIALLLGYDNAATEERTQNQD